MSLFRLANIVEGKVKQQFDKNGILFIDEDPKDFVYILRCLLTTKKNPKNLKHFRALRNAPNVPTAVPKETIDNILNLRWEIIKVMLHNNLVFQG